MTEVSGEQIAALQEQAQRVGALCQRLRRPQKQGKLSVLGLLSPVVRWLYRARLRRRLAALSDGQVAAVLVPLEAEQCSDTRKIVEPLIRRLRAPTQVIPADAPTGRGDEPAVAE